MTNRTRIASNEPHAAPPPPPPALLNDSTPAAAADRRYLETCATMFAEATANRHMAELADNLVWTLAHIAVNNGVGAAGDILRNFGTYVCRLEASKQAEIEAELAKEQGRLPN